MKLSRLLLAIAFVAAFSWPAHANGEGSIAAPQCDKRDAVLGILAEKYAEVRVAIGLGSNGGLVEVLSSKDGGTWSIIITSPKGMSCLVAAGESWQQIPVIKGNPL